MNARTLTLAAALVTVPMIVAGCGGGSGGGAASSSSSSGGSKLTHITVGTLPLVDAAPVYWAQQKGYFAKQGLSVDLQTLQGGSFGVQKVVTGQIQFSFGGTIPTAISTSKKAPVQTVALVDALGPGELGIFVKADSPIKTMADLNGKTVGINAIDNVGDVTFANLAKSRGIATHPSWVEVPFPEEIDGVKNGSIAAAYLPEPYATEAKSQGLREVIDLVQGPNLKLPISTIFTSTSYAKSNPQTVAKFVAAVDRARADIVKDPAAFRAWLPTMLKLPAATVAKMALPDFDVQLSVSQIQKVVDMLHSLGVVAASYDAAAYVTVPKGS